MTRLLALASALTLLPACKEEDPVDSGLIAEDAACEHEVLVTWEHGGKSFFLSHCTSCHSTTSPNRWGAPEYLNYDTLDGVVEAQHNIRQAALWDEVMPPGYPLEDDEREVLASLLDCGLPEAED